MSRAMRRKNPPPRVLLCCPFNPLEFPVRERLTESPTSIATSLRSTIQTPLTSHQTETLLTQCVPLTLNDPLPTLAHAPKNRTPTLIAPQEEVYP